jgi:hypothetical protein
VTGGSFFDNSNAAINVTGGALSLNSKGLVSGSLTLNDGSPFTVTIAQGKLDSSKNVLTLVATDSDGARIFGNGIKAGGSFATADLAGTWHIFTFNDHPSFNDPLWTKGTLAITSGGSVTGNLTDDTGANVAVTGGNLALDSSGEMTGSLTLAGGAVTATISQGKSNAAKTMATFVGIDSQGYIFNGVAIKAVGAFTTANLAGTWHYFNFWDTGPGNDPGWDRGTVTLNSSGTILSGSFVDSDGNAATVTGGSLSLNGSGVITSGSINFSNGVTSTISQGKMDSGKTTAAFVGTNNQGFRFFGNAIKVSGATEDIDGDGESDTAVYQTSSGNWFFLRSSLGFGQHLSFGGAIFLPVPGDYDGDGKTDTAVYDITNGNWFIAQSTAGFKVHPSFGGAGFIPVPGDYDDDGKMDVAVYQTSTGHWFMVGSTAGFMNHLAFGGSNFVPVPGDYDGDGKTDTAVYDTTNGNWFIAQSTAGFKVHPSFGGVGFIPVPGDYDNDGKMDVGVYQISAGHWFYVGSATGFGNHLAFGESTYMPVPADYDGDGQTDTAVYDTVTGNWFFAQSTAGFQVHPSFGGPGFVPVLPQVTILRALGLL